MKILLVKFYVPKVQVQVYNRIQLVTLLIKITITHTLSFSIFFSCIIYFFCITYCVIKETDINCVTLYILDEYFNCNKCVVLKPFVSIFNASVISYFFLCIYRNYLVALTGAGAGGATATGVTNVSVILGNTSWFFLNQVTKVFS